jgi:protein-arginine kinase activator protein McsA
MTETNNSVKRKEELQCELEKLKDLKNDAVKQQRYDDAANLREKQREVERALKEIEDEEQK